MITTEQHQDIAARSAAGETIGMGEARPIQPIPAPAGRPAKQARKEEGERKGFRVVMTAKEWVHLLSQVWGVRSKKGALPVLECVLLRAAVAQRTVTARATNLEAYAEGVVRLYGEALQDGVIDGAVLVAGGALMDLAKSAEGDEMLEVVESKEELVTVAGKQTRARLHGLDPNEMPVWYVEREKQEPMAMLSMASGVLRRMLRIGAACVSTDATRYVLNGVFLRRDGDEVRMVSTDGRRLVTAWATEGDGAYLHATGLEEWQFVLPTAMVRALQGLLDDGGEEVTVRLYGDGPDTTVVRSVAFYFPGGGWLACKVIEGNYPNWQQVLPDWTQEAARCGVVKPGREAFLGLVERASNWGESVRLRFESTGTVTAESGDPDEVLWQESVALFPMNEGTSGQSREISLNGEYVGMLGTVECEGLEMIVPLAGKDSMPVLWKAAEPVAGCEMAVRWVLMPMRAGG